MATSKTLTPTNVTIQIPEFTDQPDQRVNSNCLDKEADAINTLNSKISTKSVETGIPGVAAYKAGNVVMLSIVATSPASKGWFAIGTLPSELRPVMDFYTSIVLVNTDDTSAQMQITASTGYTKVYNPNATANSVNGAIMYLTAN